jgi:DNA-binding LytR/AlgR family response regulator
MIMHEKRKARGPYYPDVPLLGALIPFISAFNYYLTYSNIKPNGFLLLTFAIDTVQGYAACWGVRIFILYLDRRWPYERGPVQRIALQVAGSLVIGLLIISVLTEAVSWVVRGRPASQDFYTHDLFIISIWFFVINGIYLGLHYYHEWQKAESWRKEAEQQQVLELQHEAGRFRQEVERPNPAGLMVRMGKKDLRLDFGQLAGFYVDEDYVFACQAGGGKYCLEQSLDKIEQTVPAASFFRLNRQFILHRQLITGFKRAENGKIVVLLGESDFFPAEIPVSRTKAPAFKEWFGAE